MEEDSDYHHQLVPSMGTHAQIMVVATRSAKDKGLNGQRNKANNVPPTISILEDEWLITIMQGFLREFQCSIVAEMTQSLEQNLEQE